MFLKLFQKKILVLFFLIGSSPAFSQQLPVKVSAVQKTDLTKQGVDAFNQGKLDEARELLERAVIANPKDVEAHTFLGIIADTSGDLKKAEKHFAKVVLLAPNSASAHNNYGACLLRLSRISEAVKEFETSLKIDSNQPNALVNLGQIRFNENSPAGLQKAFELFKKADQLAPDAAIARSLVAISLRLNDSARAKDQYKNYCSRLENSGDNKPTAAEYAELGDALSKAGLYREAETELKSALALEPENSEVYADLGRVYLFLNDIPSAGKILETAAAKNIADAQVYSLLAVVYEKVGRYENAIPVMRMAISLEPESEKYRFQYGFILTNASAPAAAIIRIDQALKEFPQSSRLWLVRGVAEITAGKLSDAEKSINKALELDSNFAQAYAYLGVTRVQLGKYDEAIKLYETALKNDSSLSALHQMIADVMLNQTNADYNRIESELKKSIAADPNFTMSYLTMGLLYTRMNRWEDALKYLVKATELKPDLAEAYYQLGRVYSRLKQKDEAAKAMNKFKDLKDSQKKESDTQLRETVDRLRTVRF